MRYRITACLFALGLAAVNAAKAQPGARSYDLLPEGQAATAAADCRGVTELRLIRPGAGGWLAFLDTAVRGPCDLNILPDPRLYRLRRDDAGPGFTGSGAQGATLAIQPAADGRIQVTETTPNAEPRVLTASGQLPPPPPVGSYPLQPETGTETPATLCLEQDTGNAQAIAWLTTAKPADCAGAIPTRLYLLDPAGAAADAGYQALWITADGAYRLAIELSPVGIPTRITETAPTGETTSWGIDGATR